MSHVSPLTHARRGAVAGVLLLAALLGLLAALAPAPAAAQEPGTVKPPIQMILTDRAGDFANAAAMPGVDIIGANLSQDRMGATATAVVDFAGIYENAGPAVLRVGFGIVDGYGKCDIWGFGAMHFVLRLDLGTAFWQVGTTSDLIGDLAVARNGARVSLSSASVPGVFDGRGWHCTRISTEHIRDNVSTGDYDTVTAFAAVAPEVGPGAVPLPPPGMTAAIIDTDGDGIHDGIDSCPAVAGPATNGCQVTAMAQSLRLGTKRVVVDRMLDRTGEKCPAKVIVVVTLKGKRLARRAVGVTGHGRFCRAIGVVKLKKRVSKARVVIAGTGVGSIAATIKR